MLVEQRSAEWFDLRRGKITSSEFHKIMGDGKVRETYLLEKIAESMGGESPAASGAAIDWGVDLEDTAVEVYEARTGNKVDKCSFISISDFYGGSPDGRVGEEGAIEIKCPFGSANHFKYGLITSDAEFKKAKPDYYYQCVSHMIVTGAKWCDFISFDPRVYAEYMMFVYRLHRNEDEIENMLEKLDSAIKFIEETKKKLPKYTVDSDANVNI